MKKLFILLIIMFGIYFGIQYLFRALSPGFESNYKINSINIKETFTNSKDNYLDNYYFEINTGVNKFYLQIYNNFQKQQNIIVDIKHYKDANYECILPIFRNADIITDFKCLKNGIIYNYANLQGQSKQLDEFINSISIYDVNNFLDKEKEIKSKDFIDVYITNLVPGHAIGTTSYKGLYTIDSDNLNIIYDKDLFESDTYTRPLSAYGDDFYITANYNEKHEFSTFYLRNLKNGKDSEIPSDFSISHNSFIQGIVDNSIYMIDMDHKRQIKIDVNKRKVTDITNGSNIKHYNLGTFVDMDLTAAINKKLKFTYASTSDITDVKYYKIDKIDSTEGYYYFYKQNGEKYDAYLVSAKNKDQLTYAFSTSNPTKIFYVGHYAYYIEDSKIKYYSESTGIKTVLINKELEFNKSLSYAVILK